MLKFPVLFFTDFVRKKLVKGKKDFLSLMLQLRGLLWMVTCTEKGHYCAKSPSFPFCNDMLQNSNNSRNLVLTRLQFGQKPSSISESKLGPNHEQSKNSPGKPNENQILENENKNEAKFVLPRPKKGQCNGLFRLKN